MEDLFENKQYTSQELTYYKEIGLCFYALKKYDTALKFLHFYENYRPTDYSIANYIGDIYDIQNNKEQAIKYYELALKVLPNNYQIYGNLARLYADLYSFGEREKQLYYTETAYKLNPSDKVNIINCLLVYAKFNIVDKAQEFWKKTLELEQSPLYLFSYGYFLIHNKNFEDGLKLYRYRIQVDTQALPGGLKTIWNPGMTLKDKHVLVTYEQGFGDTMMFIRFVKDFIPLCKKVTVLVQDELYDLLKPNFNFEMYPAKDLVKLEYDCFLPLMDIPLLIGLKPENVKPISYLNVSQDKINSYKYINKNNKFKIGICSGGSKDTLRQCRDIPIEELCRIKDLPNVEVYNFLKCDTEGMEDKIPEDVIDLSSTFNSWEDTACAVKQMDLMITVDCGMLNLCGALDVKTYGLFNEYPEFRWFDLPNSVSWYKIKPFQCKKHNEWHEVMDRVIDEIKSEFSKYNKS